MSLRRSFVTAVSLVLVLAAAGLAARAQAAVTISPRSKSASASRTVGSIAATLKGAPASEVDFFVAPIVEGNWLHVTSAYLQTVTLGRTGTAKVKVTYTIDANPSVHSRSATIDVNGVFFPVTQAGAACRISLGATPPSFSKQGGLDELDVTATIGCAWSASAASTATWLTFPGEHTGEGPGSITLSVAANATTKSRKGVITVVTTNARPAQKKTWTIAQDAGPATDGDGTGGGTTPDPVPELAFGSAGLVHDPAYHATGTMSASLAIDSATIAINGGTPAALTVSGGAFSADLVLARGKNYVTIAVTDTAHKKYSSDMPVIYDSGAPSSASLIQQALDNGDITEETAVIYRVYAAFGDPRLPAEYKGEDSLADFSAVQDEIGRLGSLSETAIDALGPFLAQPFYQGSWYDLRGSRLAGAAVPADTPTCNPIRNSGTCAQSNAWTSVKLPVNAHVKVWYRTNLGAPEAAKATALMNFLETTLWPNLTGLMGRAPLPDTDALDNGGGPELDVCLIDGLGRPGQTIKLFYFSAKAVPAFILLESGQSTADLQGALTHEFMHAIQYSINIAGYDIMSSFKTLAEGTANWAVNFIFGNTNNWEWTKDGGVAWMADPTVQLTATSPEAIPYGSYVFWLYLSKSYGDGIIKSLWDATQSAGQVDAIDQVLRARGTSLEEVWPKFARSLSNVAPYDDFKRWDNISNSPFDGQRVDISLGGAMDKRQTFAADGMKPLSIYYHLLGIADAKIRSLLVLNGINFRVTTANSAPPYMFGPTPAVYKPDDPATGVKLQGMIKRAGAWQTPQDWKDEKYKALCQDKSGERVEKLLLIMTNADIANMDQPFHPKGDETTLAVSNAFCGKIEGSCSFQQDSDRRHETLSQTAFKMEPDGLFAQPLENDGTAIIGYKYKLTTTQMNYQRNDTPDDVAGWWTASYSGQVNGSANASELQLFSYVQGGKGYRGIYWLGPGFFTPMFIISTAKFHDRDGEHPVPMFPVAPAFTFASFPGIEVGPLLNADGTMLNGGGADIAAGETTGTWKLESKPDP